MAFEKRVLRVAFQDRSALKLRGGGGKAWAWEGSPASAMRNNLSGVSGSTRSNTATATATATILPSIPSVLTYTLFSLALAELLSFSGFFQDEDGINAKQRADEFKKEYINLQEEDFDTNIDQFLDSLFTRIHKWQTQIVHEMKLLSLSSLKRRIFFVRNLYDEYGLWGTLSFLSFKYQFVLGSIVGMIFQNLSSLLVKASIITYVASAMQSSLHTHDTCSEKDMFGFDNDDDDDDIINDRNSIRKDYTFTYSGKDVDTSESPLSRFFDGKRAEAKSMKSKILQHVDTCLMRLENFGLVIWSGKSRTRRKVKRLDGNVVMIPSSWEDDIGTLVIGIISGVICRSLFFS